jgi:hypothetical protein
MYVAMLHTENFEFVTVGRSEAGAHAAMLATIEQHRTDYTMSDGAPWPEMSAEEVAEYYGCRIVGPLKSGAVGARDGRILTPTETS